MKIYETCYGFGPSAGESPCTMALLLVWYNTYHLRSDNWFNRYSDENSTRQRNADDESIFPGNGVSLSLFLSRSLVALQRGATLRLTQRLFL